MIPSRKRLTSLIPIILLALFAPLPHAPTALAEGDQEPSPLPSISATIAPQIAKLEDDLAGLVQKRPSLPAATLPWLDLQIDSRIFARSLLAQTAAARDQSHLQIAGYLHGTSVLALLPAIDDFASRQTVGPDSVQTIGLGRIHQLTFNLKDAKDAAAFDKICADVAQDILIAITPMHEGNQLPALVPMRPALTSSSASTQTAAADRTGSKTIEDLAELARQASVSPPLRSQLIAIAHLARQEQSDPAQSAEGQTLHDELASALDLTAGLQTNTAVTPQERQQIESQLCDGLALFSDPRMRGAGEARLSQLDQYRQLLGRVEKMRVPPELAQALAPALAWAHENPDQGDKVLSPVEKFVALYFRQQARAVQPPEFAALRPSDPLRRAYQAVTEQFTKARGDFLGDAADIGGGTGAGGAAPKGGGDMDTGGGPDALAQQAGEMGRLEDLLDVLVAMPKTVATLDAFKSRPIGGIQRRVYTLLFAIESPIKSPARDQATAQLFDLHKLAAIADELSGVSIDTISSSIADAYAGSQLPAVQTKWKSMVTDLAAAFSVNQPMDAQKLDRLRSLHRLIGALTPAQQMETAFAKPEPLAKWADWTLPADQVHALIVPYQQAMAQAFGGFVSDSPEAIAQFAKMRPHFEPLMGLLARTGSYAPACDALPDGTLGLLSRLATPVDKSPFSEQRFASLIAACAASASGDPSVIEAAAAAISQHAIR